MNKKRVFIALAVIVALVWGVVLAVKAVRHSAPAVVAATVVKSVAQIEAPYIVTPTAPAFTAPATKCVVDPKLLPKKVQPKTKIAPKPVATVVPHPTAAYRKVVGQPVLLPN